MAASRDHLADLDRHMQLLEGKVNQLHASLTHWQQTYFEYAALKEEVDSLPKDPPPRTELARIRREYDGTLISMKEINEIFGENDVKEADQISSALGHRLDYVEKNVDTLTKLVETEENKLAAAKVIANPDGGTDEETGLPITDIIEELDDEDNVVQYRLQSGGEVGKRVEEALKKAGIQKLPKTEADLSQAQAKPDTDAQEKPVIEQQPPAVASTSAASTTASDFSNTAPTTPSTNSTKSVTFADDTKPADQLPTNADEIKQLMQKVKEQEAMDMSKAVIPEDEPEDDSQLRADMLQYMQEEIHPIVAELEIDEGSTDDENVDWDEYDDEYDEDEDDDDEDEFGRSKHSVITSDYIQRMQELEKRLGFKSAFTVERQKPQQPDDEDRKDAGGGYITVVREPRSTPAAASAPATEAAQPESAASSLKSKGKGKEKKGVRFAAELDIAPEEEIQPVAKPKPAAPKVPLVNPIGDIVEHGAAVSAPAAPEPDTEEPEPPKRVSRFKKERASTGKAAAPAVASLPPGPLQLPQRFRDQVVERSVSSAPQEPDDMDDELLYRAAAVEYNRLRNRMIQKEGGFMKPEEEKPVVPLDEEEGGPPRMSRFKAARLARSS
ncbi:Prefoldin subunit-domain-containing protein [Sordaria brevicollis]|uniref:Prefoldin subunit-domain-containing protein n=1 Tax=Sordaria brevicollis TaxID=83679 RepID=A0AAE0PAT9_SORBR|nr:Prefoldin subunit-domain-containing protein [Sordaria brevicollis]